VSLGVYSWLVGLIRVFREFRGRLRGASREGVTNRGFEQKAGKFGEAAAISSSVSIRAHPWLNPDRGPGPDLCALCASSRPSVVASPRSESGARSFVSLGVYSWLPVFSVSSVGDHAQRIGSAFRPYVSRNNPR
jgi:hypothetical protein